MADGDYLGFRPLGWLSPPVIVFPHKHSSFATTPPGESTYRVAPVKFPGDVTVNRVNTTEWLGKNKTGYQIYFTACPGVEGYFMHLRDVSPALKTALADSKDPNCRQYSAGYETEVKLCQYQMSLKVSAGDPAGESGDGASVDFGLTDRSREPLPFAYSDDYTEELLHYYSPLDYFAPEAKAQLAARLSSYDGTVTRTREPIAGEVAQDVSGTAQGNWFSEGLTWNALPPPDPAPFIALVHDYVGPEPIFSIGTSLTGVKTGLYSFTPASEGLINRDFADVKPGATYCYDRFSTGKTNGQASLGQLDGILILTLPDERHLTIEKLGTRDSTCATEKLEFSISAGTYHR